MCKCAAVSVALRTSALTAPSGSAGESVVCSSYRYFCPLVCWLFSLLFRCARGIEESEKNWLFSLLFCCTMPWNKRIGSFLSYFDCRQGHLWNEHLLFSLLFQHPCVYDGLAFRLSVAGLLFAPPYAVVVADCSDQGRGQALVCGQLEAVQQHISLIHHDVVI